MPVCAAWCRRLWSSPAVERRVVSDRWRCIATAGDEQQLKYSVIELRAVLLLITFFSAFVNVIGQRRRIFLLWCSLKVYIL